MDKSDECKRYKWSNLATNLLVSIWGHDLVQSQLKTSSRNQPIWESIARYMTRKGFPVTGLQCKTRIKNMLCIYQEAHRKNDPSAIQPYYDVFKKVVGNKNIKKKDSKSVKVRMARYSEDTDIDTEISLHSNAFVDSTATQNSTSPEYQMEFLEINNQDSQASGILSSSEAIKEFENVILKAIDSQTKAITNAIKLQSQMIEKIFEAERERLEIIMASERESRKQLESKFDKLLFKLQEISLPEVTCMGTLINTRPNP